MEDKTRYGPVFSGSNANLTAFFLQLKLNLHGKRFSNLDELRTESDFK